MPQVEIEPGQSPIYDPGHNNQKLFGEKISYRYGEAG